MTEITPIQKVQVQVQTPTFELTPTQKKIFDKLLHFLKSNDRETLLVGYAGTGKTTIVAEFMRTVIRSKLCNKIVVAAPTHKAVNIVKSKIHENNSNIVENPESIDIMTIHRALNYRSFVNSSGERYFCKGRVEPNWSIYDLLIVDECSMLSNQIIRDIKSQLLKESKIKVLYVGDPAQLPPVNQSESIIFTEPIKTLKLTKVVRTSNNQIVDLCTAHRTWVLSKDDKHIPIVSKYLCTKIKLYSEEMSQTKLWLDDFVTVLGKPLHITDCNECYNNNIILTWTNEKSEEYNCYVREKMFGTKKLAKWEVGEILVFNDYHRLDIEIDQETGKKVKETVGFYTSEQVKLVKVDVTEYNIKKFKFKAKTQTLMNPEIIEKFEKYYGMLNKIVSHKLKVYEMSIRKISDIMKNTNGNEPRTYQIIVIHKDSENIFGQMYEKFEEIVGKLKLSIMKIVNPMKNSMEKYDLESEIERAMSKMYSEWLENVVDKFAQLNYGYSMTVHKSQGSTFRNVFIDAGNIISNPNMDEMAKSLYVAIARASDSVSILI